jgi:hypothetical protein
VLLAVGFGIALTALGGLASDRASKALDTRLWALLLFALTLAGCIAAAWRRRGSAGQSGHSLHRPRRPSFIAMFAAAAAIFVTADAIVLARSPVETRVQGYTSLWISRPASARAGILIGVASSELTPSAYRVLLVSPLGVIFERRLRLDPGQNWQTVVKTKPAGRGSFQAFLYRGSSFTVPYRHVRIAT